MRRNKVKETGHNVFTHSRSPEAINGIENPTIPPLAKGRTKEGCLRTIGKKIRSDTIPQFFETVVQGFCLPPFCSPLSKGGCKRGFCYKDQKGVALVLVLWVVVLLTAIVTEFSFSMRTEVNITRNFKEEQEAYYVALAGIEQAKAEIIAAQDKMYLDENGVLVLSDDKKNFERKGKFNNVIYSYEIIDEERKININSASPDHLRYLLSNSGVEGEELDIIIDSILDWRDSDNLNRLNGAEEDYYQSLPQPYSCKDGPFDTIEELLLVKGMKREILYGSKKSKEENQKYKGIADYLTAKSSNMINVNTADRLALEAWFGSAIVESIIAQRKGGLIAVPVAGGTVKSSYFSILSTGRSGGVTRTIKTIVMKKTDKITDVLYWNDNWRESVVKFTENKPQEQK